MKRSSESKLFAAILLAAVALVVVALYPVLFGGQSPPPPPPMSKADLLGPGTRIRGDANAAYVLVEFGEYQCRSCADAEKRLSDLLAKHRTKVKYVFNFTTVEPARHRQALRLCLAAEAAGLQGKYWEMHEALFRNIKVFDKADDGKTMTELARIARELGLNAKKLTDDMNAREVTKAVERQVAVGGKAEVRYTPCFYIVRPDGIGALLGSYASTETWLNNPANLP